jgi:multiple sugar transport system permease protein
MSALGELRSIALRREAQSAGVRVLKSRKPRNEWIGYLFTAPWMIGLLGITIIPIFASLYLSFTDYRLTRRRAPTFIGLANYREMLHDSYWSAAVQVTLKYVVVSVPLQLAAALGLALLLDRGLRGLAFYRSVFYLPSLLGGSVAVSILWKQIFGYDGLVNKFLALFGIHGIGWVSDPKTALWTIVLLHIWTFGSPMIIFLAGLRQIPTMYYEAAQVDGASKWRQFRSITIPLLSPNIFFNLVLQTIGAFQSFTQAYIISGGHGLPANSTLFYSLDLYLEGFESFQMGYASAMAWVLMLVIAGVTAIFFATSRFWVHYED